MSIPGIRSAAALLIVAVGFSLASAEDAASAEQQKRRILLLRNGEVIEGSISRAENYYVIDLSNGQIRLDQSEVEHVCASLDEGYRWKRGTIQVGNVHHHIELSRWCMRHDLYGRAAVELADATAADPDHPMIDLLRNRLELAMASPPSSERTDPHAAAPSNKELDRMVDNLPPKAVETFTQSVQPVLMNNCTGSGCHGPTSEVPMRLFRAAAGRSPTRRMTQRNLYSLMQYIDRRNPLGSRLLDACKGPHGATGKAALDEHQSDQFRRLLVWMLMLAERPSSPEPKTVSLPADPSEKARTK
ncbi:MAG: hypothetical protein JW959_10160 [Pirellulales bacterium]|nr:hypothetical protein [Pirellulales bacterium]